MKIKKPKVFLFNKSYYPYYATIEITVKAANIVHYNCIRRIKNKPVTKAKSIQITKGLITAINII
jgi:hypothetical protein